LLRPLNRIEHAQLSWLSLQLAIKKGRVVRRRYEPSATAGQKPVKKLASVPIPRMYLGLNA
jgi:hypothetical protein